jgi:tRNA A-37 threonylcarbamoyl transferase component Bud32
VAHELAVFHNAGFVHGDLKSRHVLLQDRPSRDRAKVVLVDLEKAKSLNGLLGSAHDFFAARDLIQLLASLPIDSAASSVQGITGKFLEEYFEIRTISPRRGRLMRRIIELYGPRGRFQQGRTLLQCLLGEIRTDRPNNARPGTNARPAAPIGPAHPPRPGSADTARQSEPS